MSKTACVTKHKPNTAILNALAAGEAREALRLAAAFPHLGEHKEAITRGWQACTRPDFYRSLGKDPQALVDLGVAAVRERYTEADGAA